MSVNRFNQIEGLISKIINADFFGIDSLFITNDECKKYFPKGIEGCLVSAINKLNSKSNTDLDSFLLGCESCKKDGFILFNKTSRDYIYLILEFKKDNLIDIRDYCDACYTHEVNYNKRYYLNYDRFLEDSVPF
ncbi:hypothetical protein [Flavobacterium urocaniciphilum]|uniref:hypothetical protein n=1 Tax=Flavobacterium urocaniciphilum TaxID=1299341 RepID=UPI0015A5B825|nr:hypothetical protein [Flavobacterium urocaniciphilum]